MGTLIKVIILRQCVEKVKTHIQSVKDQYMYNNSIDESAFLDFLLMEIMLFNVT